MLTYRKPVECCGFESTIVIREDGGLEIEGYDIDYEVAFAAMGGGERSICRAFVEEWQNNKARAVIDYVIWDIRPILSLAVDAIQIAFWKFAHQYRGKGITGDKNEHLIGLAIRNARNFVQLRTSPPPPSAPFWDTYDIDDEASKYAKVTGGCFVQSSLDMARRREQFGEARRIDELRSLNELFNAAGFLGRALEKAIHLKSNNGVEPGEYEEHGWWYASVYNAESAINSACWAAAFACMQMDTGLEMKARYKDAMNWVVSRFVLGMREFESMGIWPELKP